MDCDHCEETFSSETEKLEHALDAHRDDMTSHDVDEAKRRLNKLRAEQPSQDSDLLRIAGMAALVLVVLGGGGYALMQSGLIQVGSPTGATSNGQSVPLGSPGSAHHHMGFSVVVDGDRVDFSQQQYQLQSRHIHFEGGDGSTIHKHATGVTIGFAMETLGMQVNASCLELRDGTTYCEPEDGEMTVTAGSSTLEEPEGYVLQDGVPVEITFETG